MGGFFWFSVLSKGAITKTNGHTQVGNSTLYGNMAPGNSGRGDVEPGMWSKGEPATEMVSGILVKLVPIGLAECSPARFSTVQGYNHLGIPGVPFSFRTGALLFFKFKAARSDLRGAEPSKDRMLVLVSTLIQEWSAVYGDDLQMQRLVCNQMEPQIIQQAFSCQHEDHCPTPTQPQQCKQARKRDGFQSVSIPKSHHDIVALLLALNSPHLEQTMTCDSATFKASAGLKTHPGRNQVSNAQP